MAVKKYIYCIAIAILTTVLLTGCGSGIELSEEENAMVAEYMAMALLKYDAQYEDELIYAEAAETTGEEFVPVDSIDSKENTETSTADATVGKTQDVVQNESNIGELPSVTLSDIYKSEQYDVSYLGVEEFETYKEENNDYFIVEAPSGCKLAVVKFTIKNISDKDITVSLAEKGITYELNLEGVSVQKPLLTALMGDVQYYNETIPTGESKVAVVVFAVDKAADISKGTITITKEDSKAVVSLQ